MNYSSKNPGRSAGPNFVLTGAIVNPPCCLTKFNSVLYKVTIELPLTIKVFFLADWFEPKFHNCLLFEANHDHHFNFWDYYERNLLQVMENQYLWPNKWTSISKLLTIKTTFHFNLSWQLYKYVKFNWFDLIPMESAMIFFPNTLNPKF